MRKLNRLTMTLALLIMAVSGAWAQDTYNVTFKANNKTTTVENVTLPHTFKCDGFTEEGELDHIMKELYGLSKGCCRNEAPTSSGSENVTGGIEDENQFIAISAPFEGTATVNGIYEGETYQGFYYSLEITCAVHEPTEWSLTPDETDKKVWTLAKMPASDVELQVEYFAESNLFLSKDALADEGSIAVKAGDLGVQFDDDGKSANTITEGTPMTVTYNGTKKLLGMKVEKKAAAPAYTLLSAATTSDYGKVVCAAGHLHDAKTAVPDGCTAVGILGKVTETGHGLILALKDAAEQSWNTINGWTSVTTYAGTTLKLLPDDAARGSLASYTTLGETAVSNWAVGQKSDYDAIFTNLGSTKGNENGKTFDDNVNAYITTGVGGTAIDGHYRSATDKGGGSAWGFAKSFWSGYEVQFEYSVRPVLGF